MGVLVLFGSGGVLVLFGDGGVREHPTLDSARPIRNNHQTGLFFMVFQKIVVNEVKR